MSDSRPTRRPRWQGGHRRWARRLFALLGTVAGTLPAACGGDTGAESDLQSRGRPPDLILISIDTLRPDHLGLYGYPKDTSPTLDSLAQQAATFEQAFAQSSWTLPSHVSLMTSTYPTTHQVDTERRSIPAVIPTLAESLQVAGYHTAGFVSWIYLAAKFGLARGFDRYHELVPPPALRDQSSRYSTRATAVVDSVLVWARDLPRGGSQRPPYFLFVHFFDPHMDYDPPLEVAREFAPWLTSTSPGSYQALEPFITGLHENAPAVPREVVEQSMALYDGEIRYTDAQIGRLLGNLRERGLLDHAVVVVTSDHGEEFAEHGSMEGHQWTLYDEVLHVPLLISGPGFGPGTRIPSIVQSIDIAPTLLELAGATIPATFQGRNLRPRGDLPGAISEDEQTFAEIGRFVRRTSLRTATHKLILTHDTGGKNRFGVPITPGYELYRLAEDPTEQRNLWDPDDPLARGLADRLRRWAETRGNIPAVNEPALSPEERERLRSVGYIGR